MIFGILVVYSEDYFTKSLLEFNKILKLTARKYKLVVVFNNNELAHKLSEFPINHIEYDYVLGSNSCHEFSGYSEGLSFVKNKYNAEYNDAGFVYCNDTFCHHRTYTFIHRLMFSTACNIAFISNKPSIAGEHVSVDEAINLNGIVFSSFISSYFFAINKQAIKLIGNDISPTKELVNQYLLGGYDEKYFFSEAMDTKLKNNLLRWLFQKGWYKSEALNQNNKDLFYAKARSIISELHLSSKAHANKLNFINTYFVIKFINKLITKQLRDKIKLLFN